jgi:hypothetical protein
MTYDGTQPLLLDTVQSDLQDSRTLDLPYFGVTDPVSGEVVLELTA